ncbi:hypothetical protein V2G26_011683 [Clonostachys chloroleuca]
MSIHTAQAFSERFGAFFCLILHSTEMDSPHGSPNGTEPKSSSQTNNTSVKNTQNPSLSQARTPPLEVKRIEKESSSEPEFPEMPPSFDWDDFEKRYEEALREMGQAEQDIFKEAENLSKYFRTWAAAASSHDDERAVKRLQTRRRFVNISEEKMAQKQQHYEDVLRAFESALALLRSA